MALRQNVAERVSVVETAEERDADFNAYNKIIDMPHGQIVGRLRFGEARELVRVWSPDAVRRLPAVVIPAFIRTAIADAYIPLCLFAMASLVILYLASVFVSSPHVAGEIEVMSYTLRPEVPQWEQTFLGTWQHWDGLWYLKIAAQGYADWDYSVAFFPFYPLVVRAFASLFNLDLLFSGVTVSAMFYLVALVYVYKLARMEVDEGSARRSLIYLAIFPTSFFFLSVYTESMYLALSAAIFYYARKESWGTAGVLSLLASLTRSTGLLLALPLLIEYLQQRDFQIKKVRTDILNLLLIPAGTVIYAIYNYFTFGDPLTFLKAQVHWERSFTLPWETLASAWDLAGKEANIPLVTDYDGTPIYQALYLSNLISGHVFNLVFLAFGLALTFIVFRKLRPAYAVYSLLVIAIPLFNPSETMPLLSMPRFVLVLFPLFFVLAMMGKNRLVHWAISLTFVTLLFFFLLRYASWYWVA